MHFVKILILFLILLIQPAYAQNSASAQFSIIINEYISITPMVNPVLIANISDRTGNLHSSLYTRFRVITNSTTSKTLYLRANIITEDGYEESMFTQGGVVYVAFGNISDKPSKLSLINCKYGGDSPKVVAYPVIQVSGTDSKFIGDKYEVYIQNGTTYIDIYIGTNVLKSSFNSEDKNGFYQAIILLTEADI